jgi:hypothetical protein
VAAGRAFRGLRTKSIGRVPGKSSVIIGTMHARVWYNGYPVGERELITERG